MRHPSRIALFVVIATAVLFGGSGLAKAVAEDEFCIADLVDLNKPAIREMQHQFQPYTVEMLYRLIRFPSVSADPRALNNACREVARLMREILPGKGKVEQFTVDVGGGKQSAPYVFGHWVQDPKLPTVLIYTHADVQPANAENWKSPPFDPVIRNGRMYGRGATDNKSGLVILLSALRALASTGALPVNVKFLVEAEEEIGSPSFPAFVRAHPDKVKADALLVPDAGSYFKNIPALAVSARGRLEISVKLEGLKNGVHSGMQGGAAPNAMWALMQLFTSLTDGNQELILPGVNDAVSATSEEETGGLSRLGGTPRAAARNIGLLPGVKLAGRPGIHPVFSIGRGSSVHAVDLIPSEGGPSTIPASATGTLMVRTAPGLDEHQVYLKVVRHLEANVPLGLRLTVEKKGVIEGWQANTEVPAFQNALAIYQRVNGGRPVQLYEEGGSIPLLNILAGRNGDQFPIILYGSDEPGNNMHGNDENVSLKRLRQNIKATIYFLSAFGKR